MGRNSAQVRQEREDRQDRQERQGRKDRQYSYFRQDRQGSIRNSCDVFDLMSSLICLYLYICLQIHMIYARMDVQLGN